MWCLAAVSLLAAALPAGAAADVPLGPPISVPPNGSTVYSVPLTAGVTYRLVLTGTVTQNAIGGCPPCITRDARGARGDVVTVDVTNLDLYYEGEASFPPYWWDLNPSTPIPLTDFSSHRYEETFTAARSGRLEARVLQVQGFVYQGGFTLELFAPAPAPVPAPAPGPSGGGSPGGEKPVTVLPPAKWGKPGPPTPLGPGDEAIALGPQIASGQREASVTVSGDPTGLIDTVLSAPDSGKKLTRGDCVRATVAISTPTHIYPGEVDGVALEGRRTRALLNAIFFLIACLDYVNELDKQAVSGAVTSVMGGAARSSCRPSTVPLNLRVDGAAGTIAYSVRRASRRDPARRLRVSCRQARNGTVTMRIKTRSRRTKLRKVLGKQLVVGLYRPRAATGTANVRTTFKRR